MKNTFVQHPLILFAMLLLSVGFISHCTNSESKAFDSNKQATEKSDSGLAKEFFEPYIDTLEVFIDSTDFGLKGKTKIELRRIGTEDDVTVHVRMFSLKNGLWDLSDQLVTHGTPITSVRPIFYDYNKDGFNDILFFSSEGGRGANEVKTLVLFDPKRNKMIWVKNSESYPNIRYNTKLGCLDAGAVYGGEMSYFLRIKGDSLVEFASVEHFDKRIIVELTDSKGNSRVIKNIPDERVGCDFCRFSNYDPMELAE